MLYLDQNLQELKKFDIYHQNNEVLYQNYKNL